MRDLIPPVVARYPAEAAELVCVAVSDGDLEAALAQYEPAAVLRLWPGFPAGEAAAAAGPAGDLTAGPAAQLAGLMALRLPVALRIRALVPAGRLALVIGERRLAGTGPDCERVELAGSGATIVRQQPGGGWRITADAWCLAGTGVPPRAPGA